MSLRDALLAALDAHPGPERTFHVHALVTPPRKHTALFPYASPRPRVHTQDILVLLAEERPGASPVLVAAVSAALFLLPTTALLYISKVDSSGHAVAPAPTRTLVTAFVAFFAAAPPARPLWIHVFARAQHAYLFPESAGVPGKRVLSDVRLCAWWRALLAAAAPHEHRWLLLPGLTEDEAARSLGPMDRWIYGHPYTQSVVPLPYALRGARLAACIPAFDDDPKARFLDELASSSDAGRVRKRIRIASGSTDTGTDEGSRVGAENASSHASEGRSTEIGEGLGAESASDKVKGGVDNGGHAKPPGTLGSVTPDEFWERMSFRQECVSGAVTGFFWVAITGPAVSPTLLKAPSVSADSALTPICAPILTPAKTPPEALASASSIAPTPSTPLTSSIISPTPALTSIPTTGASEGATILTIASPVLSAADATAETSSEPARIPVSACSEPAVALRAPASPSAPAVPTPAPGALSIPLPVPHVPAAVVQRVLTDLTTAADFSTPERAVHASAALASALTGLCGDGYAGVYGTAKGGGALPTREAKPAPAAVTVLAVRRKKRKGAEA